MHKWYLCSVCARVFFFYLLPFSQRTHVHAHIHFIYKCEFNGANSIDMRCARLWHSHNKLASIFNFQQEIYFAACITKYIGAGNRLTLMTDGNTYSEFGNRNGAHKLTQGNRILFFFFVFNIGWMRQNCLHSERINSVHPERITRIFGIDEMSTNQWFFWWTYISRAC